MYELFTSAKSIGLAQTPKKMYANKMGIIIIIMVGYNYDIGNSCEVFTPACMCLK